MDPGILNRLELLMKTKTASLPEPLRPYLALKQIEARGTMVIGPRGCGKTTFILSRIKNKNILYFSADSPLVSPFGLRDIGEAAFLNGYDGLAVDEVHFARDWGLHLKSLYDDFPQKTIIASDSSSVILRAGIADLSRRFVRLTVPLLSFREFLALKTGHHYPVIPFFDTVHPAIEQIWKETPVLALFREYLASGQRPIFLEGNYQDRLANIIEKTIYNDIPYFLPSLSDNYLQLMNAVIGYLALSPIPRLKIRSLCTEWSVGSDRLYQILSVMEHTGLIRIIRNISDHKAASAGEKILLYDPSFYSLYGGSLGNTREAWIAAAAGEAGLPVYAAKNDSEYDFLIGGIKVEVGGAGKKPKMSDYIFSDDLELPAGKRLPLWLAGLSW